MYKIQLQLLSRFFCCSWLDCLLGFCLRNGPLVKVIRNPISDGIPSFSKMSLLTSPCLMPAILTLQLDGYQSNVVYVASLRTFVSFETMIWPSRRLWEGMKIIWAPIKTPAWEARPKQRGGISSISQRMTSWMLSETKTGGDDLQSTDNDNDDCKWLPAEFRNRFSFGNVC